MTREPPAYLSFLVRLWRTSHRERSRSGDEGLVWRASLQSPLTDEIEVFASLEELFDFLRCRTSAVAGSEEVGGGRVGDCAGSQL
jgi:hypothetical protein